MQINKSDFNIVTIDDEIRVDGLCKALLMSFYEALLAEGMDQEGATRLANGADHFIRDFIVGVRLKNIFDEQPGIVRQFAGNWYIVNTLDPEIEYLADCLPGVASFYRYLATNGLISTEFCRKIEKETEELDYYRSRIDSFWEISGDGYNAWEKECSLRVFRPGAGMA